MSTSTSQIKKEVEVVNQDIASISHCGHEDISRNSVTDSGQSVLQCLIGNSLSHLNTTRLWLHMVCNLEGLQLTTKSPNPPLSPYSLMESQQHWTVVWEG